MVRPKAAPKKNETVDGPFRVYDYVPKSKRKSRRNSIPNHFNVFHAKEEHKQFYLGKICIGTTGNLMPESWTECKAHFARESETLSTLTLHFGSTPVIIALLEEDYEFYEFCKDIIVASKVFAINFIIEDSLMYFDLSFVTLPLPKFSKKIGKCVQRIMCSLYGIEDEVNKKEAEVLSDLYKNIRKKSYGLEVRNGELQHHKMKPVLRPYQRSAVCWMIDKEKQILENKESLHPLYTPLTLKSGLEVYYDKYSGYLETAKPLVGGLNRAGILADEMGLGKTVEVLSCILLHPKAPESDHNYSMSSCETESDEESDGKPTVDKMSRKRKAPEDDSEKEEKMYVVEPKKIKVPENWVKASSQKSKLRASLEMWYSSCLAETSITRRKSTEGPSVQCICGTGSMKGTVSCTDCGKIQHQRCLGYKTSYGEYRCPQCWTNQPPLDCGATLIVCPASLCNQWRDEILKHIRGSFKVLQYKGGSVVPLYPTKLQEYNVVLTTYSVLQSELRLTETEQVKELRRPKKYSIPGSPLTLVKWWRLCLDEAQTVETTASMVSAMAQKLNSHLRWAVTGTPISKDVSDLYGLIDYLQIEPYNEYDTWKNVLLDPYLNGNVKPMHNFLSQVMWRSSKDDVVDQINIPMQTVKEYHLNFSPVEHYFYKCQHESSQNSFLTRAKKHPKDKALQTLNKSELKNLLEPLVSLRSVCTCPSSMRTRYLATKKVTSMKDLLELLITKNTNECDEYLRILISSLNGLAGIYLLLQNPPEAIDQYRKVLQYYTRFTVEEKQLKLSVDKLQVIHAMHNAAEILEAHPHIEAKTLRDASLKKDCAELEKNYIGKVINQSHVALQELLLQTNEVDKLRDKFALNNGQWYSDLIDWVGLHNLYEELDNRIRAAHDRANIQSKTLNYKQHERALLLIMSGWDEKFTQLRESAFEAVDQLYTHCPDGDFKIIIDQKLVQAVMDCHLRPKRGQKKETKKKKCPVCLANDCLKMYELHIFLTTARTESYQDMSLQGSWKPTSEELIFRALYAFAKAKGAARGLIKDGKTHMDLLDALKKEFKELRKLWTYIDSQIRAQDELDMCKIRLTIGEKEDTSRKRSSILKGLQDLLEQRSQTIHILAEQELDLQRTILTSEEHENINQLQRYLGTRKYLETLRNQQVEGQKLDPCPICKNDLESYWSIIPCGHSYCLECIQFLAGQGMRQYVQCSVCRATCMVKEISHVKPGATQDETKGNFSTKVEAIIKLLLDLRNEDPDVKVIVFSYWSSVLGYLKDALTLSGISNEYVLNGSQVVKIDKFKDPQHNVTALLLPIRVGSKGLNLIEATHVVLVEPLLNPSDNLQAIGRVHRIGQTKPTFVHKFVVDDTIEEAIHKVVSSDSKSWEKDKVTVGQLTLLFDVEGEQNAESGEAPRTEEASMEIVSEEEPNSEVEFDENDE